MTSHYTIYAANLNSGEPKTYYNYDNDEFLNRHTFNSGTTTTNGEPKSPVYNYSSYFTTTTATPPSTPQYHQHSSSPLSSSGHASNVSSSSSTSSSTTTASSPLYDEEPPSPSATTPKLSQFSQVTDGTGLTYTLGDKSTARNGHHHNHHHHSQHAQQQDTYGKSTKNWYYNMYSNGGGGGATSGGGDGGGTEAALSTTRFNSQSSFETTTTTNNTSKPTTTDTVSQHGGRNSVVAQRETLHSRFDFVKVLGKGTYGKVKLANDKRTGKQVAIKIIHKNRIENKQDLARVRREIEFMSRINHPHIVKILEVYESSEKIILVMEYASGGELYDYLNERKRVSEVEARGIFRQIVSAVHFLHKNRIVHRDLKLENILIDNNGDIKLADFGLSNNWSPNNLLYTFCGSPLYASPEIVNGVPYFGPEVDCWSLGVLLYTLVYGSMPFQGGDYNRLVKQITEGQFIIPRERSGAFGLIKKCLCIKAAKRASIDDIAEHWWINVGYAYPPVVFYSYVPGAARTGVQALGYEGSPKVSPSIPIGTVGKKSGMSTPAM